MKAQKFWWIWLFLLLVLFSSNAFSTINSSCLLSGQISGADGKAPTLAYAHVTEVNETYRNAIQSVKADPTGKFVIKMKKAGLFYLWVSAVEHEVTKIPIIVTKEDQRMNVKITLKHLTYKTVFEAVKIVGNWNRFDNQKLEVMQRQTDGKFVYKGNVSMDTVSYQLMGVVDDQLVTGTMADAYEYDDDFGYRAVLKVKPGPVEIIFDPSQLQQITSKDLPKVSFDKIHNPLERLFAITYQYDQKTAECKKALVSYSEEKGDTSKFSFDFSGFDTTLERSFRDEKNVAIRKFSAIYLIQLMSLGRKPVDLKLCSEVLKIIPADSAYWGIEPNTAVIVGHSLGKEQPDLLQQFTELNPNRKVKAKTLMAIANKARVAGDKQRVNEIYAELVKRFGDIKELQYELAMLNPNKRIDKDKAVPDFTVKMLGNGETISNQNLLGKYYLLDFWASWCSKCRNEMPFLHNAYEKYHVKGFEILSLSLDDSPEDVDKFRNGQWKMPWLHSFVEGGFDNQLIQDFEVKGLPKMILIGPDGKIVASDWDLLDQNLEKILDKYLEDPRIY
jgi:thiol-disulfide isomerase/thioredoxin